MIELAASSPVVRLLVLIFLFTFVVGGIIIAVNGLEAKRRASRQIARFEVNDAPLRTSGLVQDDQRSKWSQVAQRIEAAGLSLSDSNDRKLEKSLRMAGYRSKNATRVFTLVRLSLVFILPGIYLLMVAFNPEAPSTIMIYLYCSILAVLGLYLPNLYIRAKADRRKTEIINSFPDVLDLVLVCVEAGLGLEASLDRVGREMLHSHPLIAEMLIETGLMTRAGASRELALRNLAEMSGVDEIRSFATLLIQSDKLGTSISDTLRVYASEMREARRMRAEEKAHRIPVLISIPLVVCMLPTIIGVLILPAAIGFIREIAPAMSGGG